MSSYNNFSWTLNNYTPEDVEQFLTIPEGGDEEVKYLIIGFESGSVNHTPHLQGFITFHKKVRVTGAIAWFTSLLAHDRTHVEASRRSAKINRGYIVNVTEKKPEEKLFQEWGECPAFGEAARKTNEQRYTEITQLAKLGEREKLERDYPVENIRFRKTIESMCCFKMPARLPGPCGEIFWGPTGTGKTETALSQPAFMKELDDRFTSYQGQDVMVIDELTSSGLMRHFRSLMKYADRYPFSIEEKGVKGIYIRPSRVIVTTNLTPEQILACIPYENRDPFQRRYKFVEFPLKTQAPAEQAGEQGRDIYEL